jgi:hypothetical protein
MPEPPDFEQIAHHIVDVAYTDDGQVRDVKAALQAGIAEQVRLVWNARGAADPAAGRIAAGSYTSSNQVRGISILLTRHSRKENIQLIRNWLAG